MAGAGPAPAARIRALEDVIVSATLNYARNGASDIGGGRTARGKALTKNHSNHFLRGHWFHKGMPSALLTGGFDAFRSNIRSPALQAIADHWQQARGTRRMPSWSDLRPSSIAPHLTRVWSFKYDRVTGAFTSRLAGNQITFGFGVSFRGTPLQEIHPPQIFEEVQERLTRLVLGPCVYRTFGELFRQGDHVTCGERIVLPLATDWENGDGALGASDYPMPPQAVQRRKVELIHDFEEWFSLVEQA